jgi:hypothetical protein
MCLSRCDEVLPLRSGLGKWDRIPFGRITLLGERSASMSRPWTIDPGKRRTNFVAIDDG